jgi:hypothetical protein
MEFIDIRFCLKPCKFSLDIPGAFVELLSVVSGALWLFFPIFCHLYHSVYSSVKFASQYDVVQFR